MQIGNLKVYGVIYKITNKTNNKVYIGQTIKGFNKRYKYRGAGIERVYKYHLKLKNKNVYYNKYLFQSIEKYGFQNFEVNEFIDFAFSKEELDIKEKFYIRYYNSFENGYNNNLGGEGNEGGIGLIGADNPNSKSIIQLSLDGSFIKEWEYINEVENILNINHSKISECANKKRKSAGGFIWVYKNEYDSCKEYIYIPHKQETKAVVKLSLNGDFIDRYNSITEASQLNHDVSFKGISRCCLGERKSYKGFLWIFETEYNSDFTYRYNTKNYGKSKSILVFDKDMNYIITYDSISEVIKNLGYSRTAIRNHMCNKGRIKEHILIYKENFEELDSHQHAV